ncbi:DNA N-glycosylase and apurinic/apyrimidinic (AP) lyase [Ascosphaera atra]|nr:DNA N-glycosylase and apurinic/apyrimidinic (AP) lyase [Ascosphaera atra]
MKRENPARATPVKEEPASHALDDARDESSPLSSAHTTDIEDLLGPTAESTTLKRKHEEASQEDAIKPEEDETGKATSAITSSRSTRATKSHGSPRKPKTPLNLQPPPNWEELYDRVKEMRLRNPTAPVDTMGCAELYARDSSDRDKRFHILVALMLSAQTKDTVTALAMQRLHTELGDGEDMKTEDAQSEKVAGQAESKEIALANYTPPRKSNLTLENILAVSPARLDELIRTVGFHNNKTKYIKAAAVMIRDEFNSDIPRTPKDLMRLPGVGPKMAYLAMSAAWGEVHGIGVDVHVHRITNLWGWVKTKTPEETRLALESWLPREKWGEINHLLVGLGQTVCLPVGRRCGECDLAGTGLCKAEIKGWKDKRQKRTKVVKDEEEGEEEGKIKVEMEE